MERTKMMMKGAAIALLAAAMGGAGDAAAYQLHGPPPIPCTEANNGTFYTVEHTPPGGWSNTYYYTYLCDTTHWTLWSRCGGDDGCIYY